MPNWCTTVITIRHDDPNKLQDLCEKIEKWVTEPARSTISSRWEDCWLGNIVINSGIGTVDAGLETDMRCRGTLSNIWMNSENELAIETETAWSPMLGMWLKLLERYLPEASLTYTADESGMGIYCSTDPDVVGTYNVYDEDSGEFEYEVQEEQVVKVLREEYQSNETNIEALLDILKADDDRELWVHKYEFVAPEEFY